MALRRKKRIEQRARQQAQSQQTQPAPDKRMVLDEMQKQQLQQHNGQADESTQPEELKQQEYIAAIMQNPPINERVVMSAYERLNKYRSNKSQLEKRIVANEDYWKLRQWNYYDDGNGKKRQNNQVATAWLWNCIASKHADLMDGYPESNIRPKRADDIPEAEKLKSILPVIFEENDYENTYSNLCQYILKQGVNCAGVFWDGGKHDGLGDVSIEKVDILELFWESGISDIQDSKEVFKISLEDNDNLIKIYPQLQGRLGSHKISQSNYHTDDNIDKDNKSTVVDWYYKLTDENGNQVLHFCKFVEGIVLFATENDPQHYPNGWYDHGLYPFVVTPLFPVEGSIAGYGYMDIGRGDQHAIDTLTQAILTNAKVSAKPRYFTKINSAINEAEFADWSKDFVHVQGNLDSDSIAPITTPGIPSFVVDMRDRFVDEMKETLGNRDVNNGGTTSGITAASAIAAMQEQSGKMSRVHNKIMYTMHRKITNMVIELIRQFYDIPREYRITGKMGNEQFIQYDNRGLKPQVQPNILGIQMGLRLPCFDIEVSAQKSSPYSKMEQNELAMQLYNLGVFSPQNTDMALALLQTMDFTHKEDVMQTVSANGTMLQKYQQLQKVAFQLAQQVDLQNGTNMAEELAQAILAENGQNPAVNNNSGDVSLQESNADGTLKTSEHPFVEKARAQAQESTQAQ